MMKNSKQSWKLLFVWLSVMLLGVGMLACTPEPSENNNNENNGDIIKPKPVELPKVAKADRDAVVLGQTKFAIALHKQLGKEKPGKNLFFSPYSISEALSMTYVGAKGSTAKEMADTLHIPASNANFHAAVEWLRSNLYNRSLSGPFSMKMANRLFVQKGYPLLPSFTDILKKHYETGIQDVEFGEKTDDTRKLINKWVEEQTNDRIKDLFLEDTIPKDARLVLANAIHFLGNWKEQFDPKKTYQGDFELASGNKVKTSLMRKEMSVPYAKIDADTIIFSLPYKGEELSLVIVIPKDLNTLESSLTAETLNKWIGMQNRRRGIVVLPKLKVEQDFNLGNSLTNMGMKLAFTSRADFSGITNAESLLIKKVVHKAFLEVNETGTEAAAATGVVVGPTSVPPSLHATRPFLLMIRDNTTGSILFMGRILDPTPK